MSHLDTTQDLTSPYEETLLQTFLEMVRINSPSCDEGLMRDYLIQRLEKWKTYEPNIQWSTDEGGNLIAHIPGHNATHNQVLVFSGHMDVVPPCLDVQPIVSGEGLDRIVSSDNTTVLGADDKAGLTAIIEAMELALSQKSPRPNIRLLFTTREELRLGGAKDLNDEALDADFAVTLDHTGHPGTIINEAPSYFEWTIHCYGKSTHAGIMPEKGVNAIMLASKIIEHIPQGRVSEDVTVNTALIKGGKATNVVPDYVCIRGEVRGHDFSRIQQELENIQQAAKAESEAMPGSRFEWDVEESFRGYSIPSENPAVQHVIRAAKQAGLEPELIKTNGGSDNNIFVHRGLPGIVLSACFIGPHMLTEQVRLKELHQSARFLTEILKEFAHHGF